MNKSELVDAIAEKTGLTKQDSKSALDALVATVKETLAKGDKVTLVGFGTFSVVERPARTGRNPRTGAPLNIEAKNIAKFKPGSDFSF